MSRAIWLGSMLLLLTTALVAGDKEDANKKELEKFQGQWKLTQSDEITVKIKGNEYEFKAGGQSEKGKLKFNPSATPPEVDAEITEGNDAGKKQVGIYELKGDKFKFCFAMAGDTKRPKKFEASGDGAIILFEFEKVKK